MQLAPEEDKLLISPTGRYISERNALEVFPEDVRRKIENRHNELDRLRKEKILKDKEIKLFSILHSQKKNVKKKLS